ncbi:MAG: hypothetical protein HYV28_15420 [Ignavibacteriales bacterium]|nr:hypothetical protein [Ignavibacteriales bacterium]
MLRHFIESKVPLRLQVNAQPFYAAFSRVKSNADWQENSLSQSMKD